MGKCLNNLELIEEKFTEVGLEPVTSKLIINNNIINNNNNKTHNAHLSTLLGVEGAAKKLSYLALCGWSPYFVNIVVGGGVPVNSHSTCNYRVTRDHTQVESETSFSLRETLAALYLAIIVFSLCTI